MISDRKVIVAMSGGVDSSVAALLYRDLGFDVTGVTLRLKVTDNRDNDAEGSGIKSDERLAAEVAERLGINHVVLDFSAEFRNMVLRPCWDEFNRGRTPNPCAICNPRIKFGKLFDYADRLGAGLVITGHYARTEENNGRRCIRRGTDPNKDQTYFLFGLPMAMVERIRFPLGELSKAEVRRISREAGLPTHDKPDSQDTCFSVPGESFQESLRKLFAAGTRPGTFTDTSGKTVGRHDGVHQFTIGQRKGLGIALGKPGYVVGINAASNQVIVSTDENKLMADAFHVAGLNWQTLPEPDQPFRTMIQVRYRSVPVAGTVTPAQDGAVVVLDAPLRAITPGQAAVFYRDDILLGGGFITEVDRL